MDVDWRVVDEWRRQGREETVRLPAQVEAYRQERGTRAENVEVT